MGHDDSEPHGIAKGHQPQDQPRGSKEILGQAEICGFSFQGKKIANQAPDGILCQIQRVGWVVERE